VNPKEKKDDEQKLTYKQKKEEEEEEEMQRIAVSHNFKFESKYSNKTTEHLPHFFIL
jgi:hypothetical protein